MNMHTLRIAGLPAYRPVYGVFYRKGVRHIVQYTPFEVPPRRALCGHEDDLFTGTRSHDNMCPSCLTIAEGMFEELHYE